MSGSHRRMERRDVLKLLVAACAGLTLNPQIAYGFEATKKKAAAPEAHAAEKEVLQNRAPLAPNAFNLLPLGSVRPTGWLRRQLEVQATGLGGHLDETWADVGSNSGWLGGTGESWERGPYFLDGLVPLAYLLDDDRLKAKAQRYIDWTLTTSCQTA